MSYLRKQSMKKKILAVHKDLWSYEKFRKNILGRIVKRKNYALDNLFVKSSNKNHLNLKNIKKKKLNNYEAIFVYGIRQIYLFCFYRKFSNIKSDKVFFFFTGLGFIFTNRNIFITNFIFFITNYLLLKKKDIIIVQNSSDFNLFKIKFKKNKINIIRGNGSNIVKSKKVDNKKLIRIVFAARLIKNKGIKDLIEIIRKLNKLKIKKKYEFFLYLKIDNNNIDKYEKLDELNSLDNTKLFYNFNDLQKEINISDIGILTSYREGFSQFLLECISNSLPIVSYNVPGCSEMISNNVNGFLIEKFNTNQFVKKIKKLIEDDKKRSMFSEKSSKIAIDFSYTRIEKNYLELIDG